MFCLNTQIMQKVLFEIKIIIILLWDSRFFIIHSVNWMVFRGQNKENGQSSILLTASFQKYKNNFSRLFLFPVQSTAQPCYWCCWLTIKKRHLDGSWNLAIILYLLFSVVPQGLTRENGVNGFLWNPYLVYVPILKSWCCSPLSNLYTKRNYRGYWAVLLDHQTASTIR